ncbi:NAD(P)/FAD-dependent oxidoreductase [Clostridium grantii]|uniref:Thioredoxin reductase (NADPH) n=1 Tax=Clostridium grantii DSM 8605 TaxID=1121316 RepID=A0A1M5X565_9CLOT|nr:FAD-dependent oxidoreductase [Clostridium grantii]SHH94931.1 thioredoxin reductase (NADPH) [Clostridium grantii DSM 8605]
MDKKVKKIDLLIIGAGPAGLTASIYAARAKLNTLTLEEGLIGGQVKDSYEIENYPGFIKVSGLDLSEKMSEQATEQGAVIDEFDRILCINLKDDKKYIETDNFIYLPKSVIITTGSQRKRLPIAEEEKYHGKGIHYCELCDGSMYEGKELVIVGGGNSAVEAALYLKKIANKITIINRGSTLKADKANQEKLFKEENIDIIINTVIENVIGEDFVEGFNIKNSDSGETSSIKAQGAFVYVGTEPMGELFKNYIERDEYGYIITNEDMETNIKGVYAAGDIRHKRFRQITTAVGDGTIAALMAEKFISK